MKKLLILSLLLVLISLIVSLYYYPFLPDEVASHWGVSGEANGYSSKGFGAFFFPGLMFVMFFFLAYIPKLDPLKENIKKFEKEYHIFIVFFFVYFLYIHLLTIFWNLGYKFNMSAMIIPGFGALFFVIGFMIEKAKQNYFIGIRTPWTLASEKVWDKTHKAGGKLFKAIGLISIGSMIFPKYYFILLLVMIFAIVVFSFGYSYYLFRLEKTKKK